MRRFVLAFILLAAAPAGAYADLHFWFIQEAYSNADGSVQFIELFTNVNDQERLATSGAFAHTFDSNANQFVFPTDLPSSQTAGKHFLLGTAGLENLPGGVAPDYVIPSQFFNVNGDTLDFSQGISTLTFGGGQLPTDGVLSIGPGGATATNSPTNFSGDSGSIVPEPATAACLMLLSCGMLLRRRRLC